MSVTVSIPGSGLVFVNTYDAGDTAAYEKCIVDAEKALEHLYTNKVTIKVEFKEMPLPAGELAKISFSIVSVSYAALTGALPAGVDTDLPAADPNPAGGKDWWLPDAYARMLGLSKTTPAIDDVVTLNSSVDWSYTEDVINTIEHELSEGGMGRVGGLGDKVFPGGKFWSTMDLFRYSAPLVHDYADGKDGKTTYFSSDGTTLSSSAGLSFHNEFKDGMKVDGADTADFEEMPPPELDVLARANRTKPTSYPRLTST